jgi:ABC-type uncharacterized transport system auxiliary subunit
MKARLLVSLMVVCSLGGCFPPQEFTPVRYYTIEPLSLQGYQVTRTWPITLGVQPFTAATRYEDRILYRLSEVEVGFYEYDRWVEPPEEMVTRVVTTFLRTSGLFQLVTSADNVRLPAWILSGEVTRFDEVRTPAGSQAECWLRLELRRARDEQLLWSEVLTATTFLSAETSAALAQAMSQAVHEIALHLVERLSTAALPGPQTSNVED